MKRREQFPFDEHTINEKPVVAVLLTCGLASRFPEFGNIKYKALLLLKGRPIVDFVSTALCISQVEKVFVVHAPDEDIKKTLTSNEKIVFAECSRPTPTLTDSGMCALEKLFEYYGENKLAKN
jgi:CTP:molybdopterin cytidylyltransferase MocA